MKKIIGKSMAFVRNIPIRIWATSVFFVLLGGITYSMLFLLTVVNVEDGEEEKMVMTIFSSQEEILDLAEVEVNLEDKILYTSYGGEIDNLRITRFFNIPIQVDGKIVEVKMNQGTVQDCLAKAEIVLGEHDYTTPSLHSSIQDGDEIRVYRVEYQDNSYSEVVPHGTTYRSNSLIYRFKNNSYTISEGYDGENLVTYRERYVDGELDYSLESKVEVVTKPVDDVVLTYSHEAVSPLPAPDGISIVNNVPSSYKQVISNVAATGYYSSRGKGSSGLGLFYGSVAVNPNVIPYGSKLYITSPDGEFVYGFAIATDTGTALMEGIIGVDLFYETYKESSLNWKNVVNIYIL